MVNLKALEANTWAQRTEGKHTKELFGKFEGTRLGLFELLDVTKYQIESFLFTKEMIEVRDELKTIESLRSFRTLPKWLKKRMKFRLRRISNYPDLKNFIEGMV